MISQHTIVPTCLSCVKFTGMRYYFGNLTFKFSALFMLDIISRGEQFTHARNVRRATTKPFKAVVRSELFRFYFKK